MNSFLSTFLIVFVVTLTVFAQSNYEKAAITYNQGLEFQQKGDDDKALAAYDQAILLNPKLVDAYNNRANIKLLRNDPNGAVEDFSKVIEINPKYPLSYYNRGTIYVQIGKNDEAITDFTKAISIFEGLTQDYDKIAHAQSYFGRASALQGKGLIKESLPDFDKALQILPKSIETLITRGVVKQSLKDYQGAIADYTKAIEIFPRNAVVYLNRGTALENINVDSAIADFSKAIELDPKQSQAFVRRALLYLKLKKNRQALQDFEKAFLLEPGLKTEYKGFYADAKKPS